jgi:hypothetical protein
MDNVLLVTFVLDVDCGELATTFAQEGPVWAVNSPVNAAAAEKAIQSGLSFTLLFANGETTEEWCLNHLDSVDQHHNEYSHKPGYSVLRVVGTPLTPRIETYLPEFGFVKWQSTSNGFYAYKS